MATHKANIRPFRVQRRLETLLSSLYTSAFPVSESEIRDQFRQGDWRALMRQSANLDALFIVSCRIDTKTIQARDPEQMGHRIVERRIAEIKRAVMQYRSALRKLSVSDRSRVSLKQEREIINLMNKNYARAVSCGRTLYAVLSPGSLKFYDYSLGIGN